MQKYVSLFSSEIMTVGNLHYDSRTKTDKEKIYYLFSFHGINDEVFGVWVIN